MVTRIALTLCFNLGKNDIGRNIEGRHLRERFLCYSNLCLGVELRLFLHNL